MAKELGITARRSGGELGIIDIRGEVTGASEDELMEAYAAANEGSPGAMLLNFAEMEYMNSTGIGLLVTLLIRANRHGQRMLAVGLNDHYRQIFQLTRLDEAITLCDDEAQALAVGA